MLYVQLDVNWPENPKRIRAGLEGSAMHAICLCLAKRTQTNGWIDRTTLSLYGGTDELLDRLVVLDLLDAEGDRVRPHGWLEQNLSAEAIREVRAEKSRMANHARWHAGPYDDCAKCEEKRRSSHTDPPAIQPDPEVSLEVETALEAEPAATPDARRTLLEAAAAVIGERAASRPTCRHPDRTRLAVSSAIITDRYQDAYQWINDNPSGTPEQLAEHLEPTTKPNALDPLSTAQAALADRTRRQHDGTACPDCGDNLLILGDDGLARRCGNQRHTGASA